MTIKNTCCGGSSSDDLFESPFRSIFFSDSSGKSLSNAVMDAATAKLLLSLTETIIYCIT